MSLAGHIRMTSYQDYGESGNGKAARDTAPAPRYDGNPVQEPCFLMPLL